MLFLLTILVVLSAVVSIAVLLKFKKNRQNLSTNYPQQLEPPQFRSLFEPDEAEIRAFEKAEKAKLEAEKREKTEKHLAEKVEKVRDFSLIWSESPNRKNTVELLYLASQSENVEVYQNAAKKVLEFWKEGKLVNFSADDLADILESHFWLISSEKRTSGVKFGLYQELADLRRSVKK